MSKKPKKSKSNVDYYNLPIEKGVFVTLTLSVQKAENGISLISAAIRLTKK